MKKCSVKIDMDDALAALDEMRLMDDVFMQLCFDGAPDVVELVLRIVLDMPQLHVVKLETQKETSGVGSRSVRFDVLTQDECGTYYNIEIQRDERGASPVRARYYSSALDVHLSETGEKFDKLPNTVVVFITETDTLHRNKGVTVFERRDDEGVRLCDGSRIVYVNGQWRSDDSVGRLMSDFMESDPKKMNYPIIANRVQSIKKPAIVNEKEGNMSEGMYKILSKYGDAWRNEGREEGMEKGLSQGLTRTARAMLAEHLPIAVIVRCTGLTESEVTAMAGESEAGQ